MNETLISIITPNYNSSRFILDTYNSIQSQTYKNWEWLITDDCSKDDSYFLIDKISKKDKRVKLHRNKKNLGAAVSRNSSISRADGKFLAFIDSDDLWQKNKLQHQFQFMIDKDAAISFTPYKIISETGIYSNKIIDISSPDVITYSDLLFKKATFGCSTVMISISKVGKVVMPNIRTGQDYATWLSILKLGYNAYVLREPLTSYRVVSNSISRNKIKKAKRQWEIYRSIEKISLSKSIIYFISYAFRAIFR
tara:strand:+ start:17453 stop:18208 length:756 start_codon:yes stop_codon:yes gene_type:complete